MSLLGEVSRDSGVARHEWMGGKCAFAGLAVTDD